MDPNELTIVQRVMFQRLPLQHINFYALHQGLHSTGLNVSCPGKLKRHTTSRIVKCVMKGEIPPGQTENWDNELLQVPSLPPSRLDGCKLIEIFYTVTVRLLCAIWSDIPGAGPWFPSDREGEHQPIIRPNFPESCMKMKKLDRKQGPRYQKFYYVHPPL